MTEPIYGPVYRRGVGLGSGSGAGLGLIFSAGGGGEAGAGEGILETAAEWRRSKGRGYNVRDNHRRSKGPG